MKPEWNGRAARPYHAEQWASSKNSKLMRLFFFNWSVRFAPPTARESHFPERKPALCVTITTTAKFSTHLCFFNVPSFSFSFRCSDKIFHCRQIRYRPLCYTQIYNYLRSWFLCVYELIFQGWWEIYLPETKRERSIKKNVKYSNTKRYTARCLRNA